MNTYEAYSQNEITELRMELGETVEIFETSEGLVVTNRLQDSKSEERQSIEGGQEIELLIGSRIPLPIDLKAQGCELSGLPIKSLKINGKAIEGYSFFICPQDQDGNFLIGANFADAESRVVVISSLRDSYSLLILSHEVGHVGAGHGLNNRTNLSLALNEKVYNKYIDRAGTVNTHALKEDSDALDALKAIYEQEIEANRKAIEFLKGLGNVFPHDSEFGKASLYLKQEIDFQYLGVYGLEKI